MMCGGVGTAKEMTDEVRSLVVPLRDAVHAKAQASGWNGTFAKFEPVTFASQVCGSLGNRILFLLTVNHRDVLG